MEKSKVIVVTGASSGIGRAIAQTCADHGWQVVATARRKNKLQELQRYSERIHPVAADITDAAAPAQLIAAAAKLGRLRAIVHSAGSFKTAPVAKIRIADWENMVETNVTPAIRLLQVGAKHLENGGVFIGISSTAGLRPVAGYSAYCATKGALNSFLQSAALELAPRGIRVHAVAPGIVETPMVPHAGETGGLHPLGRPGLPSDIAAAVRFLLGPEAGWMTGVILPVDGGISLT
jgi:NAD(P)-dependent dehydrogenase (short-subunit alcohol dehydrogenase family)